VNVNEMVDSVRTREDLVRFVRGLLSDLKENPDDWENTDLARYLEALAAWVEDMDGVFKNRGEPVPERPDWKTLAQILLAASIYE
jgi:hypothetical protein